MSTCELWLRGTVENYGPQPLDALAVNSWNSADPLPTATFHHHDSRGWDHYTGGESGNINVQTGWYGAPEYYLKNCTGTPSPVAANQPYDCINGECLPKSTYKSPGKYSNLAACQSGCGKDSNCTGECIPSDEIAALQSAVAKLKGKICK